MHDEPSRKPVVDPVKLELRIQRDSLSGRDEQAGEEGMLNVDTVRHRHLRISHEEIQQHCLVERSREGAIPRPIQGIGLPLLDLVRSMDDVGNISVICPILRDGDVRRRSVARKLDETPPRRGERRVAP